jgi:ATP-dependent helicase/nuclease subunit A
LATADGDRFKRGLLIHKLLQVLPELPVEQRRPVAKAILARPVHGLLDRQQGDFLREVMAVLDNPDHGAFFGPQSRAEVPIVGQIGQGPSAVTVAGQIDRLAVFDSRVVILDYKTNRPAPAAVDDVPAAYRAQLRGYRDLVAQLYQDRPVECYLLWTDGPRLMRVNDEILDMGPR